MFFAKYRYPDSVTTFQLESVMVMVTMREDKSLCAEHPILSTTQIRPVVRYLGGNDLKGSIPTELGSLPKLQKLCAS